VNWEFLPRPDDFSQEFADLDDALRYANGEDDSYFAESTVPAQRSLWPGNIRPSRARLSNSALAVRRRATAIPEPEAVPGSKRLILTEDAATARVPRVDLLESLQYCRRSGIF
jgi:hypothetical protein